MRIVVPFAPGGPVDVAGRLVAERLRDRLGVPFVLDNRPGAGGSLGIRLVAAAPPDGATLLLTSSSLAIAPALHADLGLDPRRDLTPLSLVLEVPTTLVVRADAPFPELRALLAAARARPGTLTYGSSGVGSSNHLTGALLATTAGLDLVHVPYRGAAGSMTALYAGEVAMVFASTVETMAAIREGRVRALGVATPARVAALSEVPAIAEAVPGYAALNWFALAGPRGLPEAVVARLSAELAAMREAPELRARLAAAGTVPLLTGPEELAARLAADVPLWQRVVAQAGIRAE